MGRLFDTLASFENLYRAARDVQRGKRFKPAVARFHYDVARSLLELRDGKPILLKYGTKSGHSGGKPVNQQIDDDADWISFLWEDVEGAETAP